MNKRAFLSIFTFTLILVGAASSQACDEPSPPAIPDPNTAVLAEMVKAQKDVKKFISSGDSYLKCQKNDNKYNKMVDLMKTTGDEFNKAIKAFKAKVKK
jgi:hypothetical protein